MALVEKNDQGTRVAYTLEEVILLVWMYKAKIAKKVRKALFASIVPALVKQGVAAIPRTEHSIGYAYMNKVFKDDVETLADVNKAWDKAAEQEAIKKLTAAIKETGGEALKVLPGAKTEAATEAGKTDRKDQK